MKRIYYFVQHKTNVLDSTRLNSMDEAQEFISLNLYHVKENYKITRLALPYIRQTAFN